MTHALHEPPALTISDVAYLLNLSERRVRQFVNDGTIPANKLGPEAQHTWRIPRSSLDPWLGPYRPPAPAVEATPDPAPSNLSREAIRARAGLDPEPGPSQSFPAHDAVTDVPTGSVAPAHPTPPRAVVRMASVTRYPDSHPSEQYLSPEERVARRAARDHAATERLAALDSESRSLVHGVTAYEGTEAEPFDGTCFGAGPADDLDPAA